MANEFPTMNDYAMNLVGGMKKKGMAKGGAVGMKKKGYSKGGATKMTLAKLRAAAKKMGYKLVKV